MKRKYLAIILAILALAWLLSACVAAPAQTLLSDSATKALQPSETAGNEADAAEDTPVVVETKSTAETISEVATTEVVTETQELQPAEQTPDESQVEEPATAESETAAPEPPASDVPPANDEPQAEPPPERIAPSSEFVRDHVLDFLRGAYRFDYPANDSFVQADLPLDTPGFELVNAFESAPYQLFVGSPYLDGERIVTPVILYNPKSEARWWGEVGDDGLVTTVVAARMPRPRSSQVNGWIGHLVKLPPGSPYDDYFEGGRGLRHGIDTNRDNVAVMLDSLTDYDGRIRIFGELRYGVPDYNGRSILVRQIELLDERNAPPPNENSAEAAAETEAVSPEPTPFFGPIGAILNPVQGDVLAEVAQVRGEAEGVDDNRVVIRIEAGSGETLGEALVTTDAASPGAKGFFTIEIPILEPPTAGPGRVALYAENATDGSLELLAWTNINLAGPITGKSATIFRPEPDSRVKGRTVVSGEATNVINDVVLVRVEDLTGEVWGQSRARVQVFEAGSPGEWETSIDVRRPRTPRAGRIAVYDINPQDDSVSLLAEIGVRLAR
ncbi:MAG: hypothetical protein J5I90_22630 [Caldilineales bacterium]|nr:hypothetical protein [Caldilineales bacterium]